MNTPVKPAALPNDHPMSSRQTVGELRQAEGNIIELGPANYGIQTVEQTVLLPLNLPDDFQEEGMKISFSGSLKEIGLNEFMAGQPLILTEITRK